MPKLVVAQQFPQYLQFYQAAYKVKFQNVSCQATNITVIHIIKVTYPQRHHVISHTMLGYLAGETFASSLAWVSFSSVIDIHMSENYKICLDITTAKR